MKLELVLDQLNSFEKNAFLKVIGDLISKSPKNAKAIDEVMGSMKADLKNVDSVMIAQVFRLLSDEFCNHLRVEFLNVSSQLDIVTDIIIKDGNCMMKQDWFSRLYENEIKSLTKKVKTFKDEINKDKSEFDEAKRRDYKIYRNCLETAYRNDESSKLDPKITSDEQSILQVLSKSLGLSQEELKLINYSIMPLQNREIGTVIDELRLIGVAFFSKRNNMFYVPDEMVKLFRRLKGKEVADKYYRRTLQALSDPQINLICRKHSISLKLSREEKIKEIIHAGISYTGLLTEDLHKEGTKILEKRNFINHFASNSLQITRALKGTSLEEKVQNIVAYFDELDNDDKVSISVDGYERLLMDLNSLVPSVSKHVQSVYEFQEEQVMSSSFLLPYNIKPQDLLEILKPEQITAFCAAKGIKSRGGLIANILKEYEDVENLFLENYVHIGTRNLPVLKENGIIVKEADLGLKFEELTKKIFKDLGFEIDEKLRSSLNTKLDKMDILIRFDEQEVIIVECKSVKEAGYNKFSSVSRQLGAYKKLVEEKGLRVKKILLVAPQFSDDFVNECTLDLNLGLSLITAQSLLNIRNGLKNSRHKQLPVNLLLRDVEIRDEVVLKAINR